MTANLANKAKKAAKTNTYPPLKELIKNLCSFVTGVVTEGNESLFKSIQNELPELKIHRYPSGSQFNGWEIQKLWKVEKALIKKNGQVIFDGTIHPIAVAIYSKSFEGELSWEELNQHIVTNSDLPTAHIYHCMWQYRPWEPDWAFCIPYETYQTFEKSGLFEVELITTYEPGEMLVGEYTHQGRSDKTIVFNSHTCHPHMANDGFCGSALFIRLLQELKGRDTYYSYRLIMAPEHLGTIFYLHNKTEAELEKLISGVFVEMIGTPGPLKATSSFLGQQPIDQILSHCLQHYSKDFIKMPWRQGAGNDETVWEAPGYEVPFVELTRCLDTFSPFPEYHTSLDTWELMDEEQLQESYLLFKKVIDILENNSRVYRKFNGLICLSNPQYDLYLERPDPSVNKILGEDSEKWGQMQDSLLRYFDGSMTILDIAQKHELPFERIYNYLLKFQDKGLVELEFESIKRIEISKKKSQIDLK